MVLNFARIKVRNFFKHFRATNLGNFLFFLMRLYDFCSSVFFMNVTVGKSNSYGIFVYLWSIKIEDEGFPTPTDQYYISRATNIILNQYTVKSMDSPPYLPCIVASLALHAYDLRV